MILESVDEVRAQGVTVYPHVVEPKAQPLDVSRVAATLLATYSRSWCVRLMEDMAKALGSDDGAVVWWLAQMTPAALESVAQQLASGNAETAYVLATRLESKLYTKVPHGVHIAQLLAAHQPDELLAIAQQLATADVVRADALRIALDAAVSARLMADTQDAPMQADVAEAHRLVDLPCSVMMAGTATECVEVAP